MAQAGYLRGLFFDPEDGGDIFLRDVDRLQTDYIYIPKDRPLHNHKCENLESYMCQFWAHRRNGLHLAVRWDILATGVRFCNVIAYSRTLLRN
jgi:hypothetical protein